MVDQTSTSGQSKQQPVEADCGCDHDHDHGHHHHHHHAPVVTQRRAGPKIGRNDACPCGSGKKYKKCCLGRE